MKSEARHKCDYVILNSVSQTSKVIPILRGYKHVRCYFDNDAAGRNSFEIVRKDVNAISCSEKMLPHNDVNDYLCSLRVRSPTETDTASQAADTDSTDELTNEKDDKVTTESTNTNPDGLRP